MLICPHCCRRYDAGTALCPSHAGEPLLPLDTLDDPRVGTIIDDRYLVTGVLGTGGMGRVYRAWQRSTHRAVAVKLIQRDAGDPTTAARFLREARITANLKSPHTVTVYDSGQLNDGGLYMVMELLEGRDLSELVAEHGPLTLNRLQALSLQLCDSVFEAHALGLVHRDIKPANLLVTVTPTGVEQLHVLDFGVAKLVDQGGQKLTRAGASIGSLAYMSPEQVAGSEVGPATDIYAIGVTLFALITGRLPFERSTSLALMLAHRQDAPPSLLEHCPRTPALGQLDTIVQRCLAKTPAQRFATVSELRAALAALPVEQPLAIAIDDTLEGGAGAQPVVPRAHEGHRSGPMARTKGDGHRDPATLPGVSAGLVLEKARTQRGSERPGTNRPMSPLVWVLAAAALATMLWIIIDG